MPVRRVRRVVRKFDPWTVLKVSIVFNAIAGLIFVLGIWVAWSLAIQRGIPDKISEILGDFSIAFTPDGELYFRVVLFLAVVIAIGATMLMSDMVGGIEILVLEETYAVQPQARPTRAPAIVQSGNGRAEDADTEPVPLVPGR